MFWPRFARPAAAHRGAGAALINEFADLPGEVFLVLDDYHLIDSEASTGSSPLLLERLPEACTSLSRAAPTRRCR